VDVQRLCFSFVFLGFGLLLVALLRLHVLPDQRERDEGHAELEALAMFGCALGLRFRGLHKEHVVHVDEVVVDVRIFRRSGLALDAHGGEAIKDGILVAPSRFPNLLRTRHVELTFVRLFLAVRPSRSLMWLRRLLRSGRLLFPFGADGKREAVAERLYPARVHDLSFVRQSVANLDFLGKRQSEAGRAVEQMRRAPILRGL